MGYLISMASEDPTTPSLRGVGYRVFLRSFFLETLWNYQKMQNVGFVFCLYPALRTLYPDETALRDAVRRNLEPVNTHPSMSPLLAGLTVNLENQGDARSVLVYRLRVMTTLAAQGDRIFWGLLKPFAAVLGVLVTLVYWGSLFGAVLTIVTYNTANISLRATGFRWGWLEGLAALKWFQSGRLERTLFLVRKCTVCVLGLIAGTVASFAVTALPARGLPLILILEGFGIFGIGLAAFYMLHKNVPLGLVIFLSSFGALFFFALLSMESG